MIPIKKIQLVFTGGTISMRYDVELGAAVPMFTGREIVDKIPGLERIADFDIDDFSMLPGPHVTPAKMLELANRVRDYLNHPEIDGVVITHGTDTLEETAFLLDLVLQNPKPVVLVGAMRTSSDLSWDGPANLAEAMRVATADDARDRGVMVTLSSSIHAGSEVTKTHTESVDTFQSPDFGPLGLVERDRVLFYRRPVRRVHVVPERLDLPVALLKMYSGADDSMLRWCLDGGARGIVVEALGRGNVPPAVLPGIEAAIEQGVPVVVVSRCPSGRVLDTYGYPGGGKDLRRLGVIFGGFLNGPKARLALMAALGAGWSLAEIRGLFEAGLYD